MALYIGSTKIAGGNIMGVNDMIAYVLNTLYPVGAVFSTTDSNDPSEHFGFGLWQSLGTTTITDNNTTTTIYLWKRMG